MVVSFIVQNILNEIKIKLEIRVSHFYVSNLRLHYEGIFASKIAGLPTLKEDLH